MRVRPLQGCEGRETALVSVEGDLVVCVFVEELWLRV